MQLHLTALEDRANGHGELALARSAAPQASSTALYERDAVEAATAWTIGSLRPHNRFEARDCCGFIVKMWLGQQAHG
jgi:hypothetical protein